MGQANVILQVTNKKAVKDKYKVAVVKREVEFSKETYNRAYNDFSQFIAANPTAEKMIANAEEAGYKLLDRRDLYSSFLVAIVKPSLPFSDTTPFSVSSSYWAMADNGKSNNAAIMIISCFILVCLMYKL